MDTSLTPSNPSAVSLTHASIQRLASQSASCKITSAILSGAAMLFAAGRAGGDVLLWATAPVGLLALADASYTAKTRRLAGQFQGNTTPKLGDLIANEVGRGGAGDAVSALKGLLSFSVWPYYTSLAVLVAGLGSTVLVPKTTAPVLGTPFNGLTSPAQMHSSVPPNAAFPSNNVPRPAFPQGPPTGGATGPGVGFPQPPGRQINRVPGAPGAGPTGVQPNRPPLSPTTVPSAIKPPSTQPNTAPSAAPSSPPASVPSPAPAPAPASPAK